MRYVQATQGADGYWTVPENPIWTVPDHDTLCEVAHQGGTFGEILRVSGLAMDARGRVYGWRTMRCRESGHDLEGRVAICGERIRAFTSHANFIRPDGKVITVGRLYVCGEPAAVLRPWTWKHLAGDDKTVPLPNAQRYNGGAVPGQCIACPEGIGRVLGRVTIDGRDYVAALIFGAELGHAFFRAINPDDVTAVFAPPRRTAAWFFQDTLPDPATCLRLADYGTLSEQYIADPTTGPKDIPLAEQRRTA